MFQSRWWKCWLFLNSVDKIGENYFLLVRNQNAFFYFDENMFIHNYFLISMKIKKIKFFFSWSRVTFLHIHPIVLHVHLTSDTFQNKFKVPLNEKYNNFIMNKWNDFLRKRFIHLSSEKSYPRLILIGYRDPQSLIIFLLDGHLWLAYDKNN
jgi:hypothetical protein